MDVLQSLVSNNITAGREAILFIVPHTYGARGDNLFGWFNNPNAQASAHYSVEKNGTVRQYVKDENTAWACSNWWANRNSISIEFQDDGNYRDSVRSDELYQKGGELMAQLSIKHLNANDIVYPHSLKLHREFAPSKACPGGLDYIRLANIANNLLQQYRMNNERAAKLYKWLGIQRKEVIEFKNPSNAPAPFYTVANILVWWYNWGIIEFTRQILLAGMSLPSNYTPDGLLDYYFEIAPKMNPWTLKPTNSVKLPTKEQTLLDASKEFATAIKNI